MALSAGATFLTVQVKVRLLELVLSDAVAVTVCRPVLVDGGVPEIRPVAALTVSGAGRPVALYVSTRPSGSLATSCSETVVLVTLV